MIGVNASRSAFGQIVPTTSSELAGGGFVLLEACLTALRGGLHIEILGPPCAASALQSGC
jgi:hypothetical protein